jgi:hypothetical protein
MLTRRSWKWIVVALLATEPLLFAAAPPAADGSSPLGRYLYQNGFVAMHVDNNGHNQSIVRVSINGAGATLVLDTGCGRTCITDYFARNLKLDVQKGDPMVGVGGKVAGESALLDSFAFGNTPINRMATIRVLPPRATAPEDGMLGYDYMRLNSVILPVGANYFLYRPASEPPVEIDSFLKAEGFQPIPLTFGEGGLRAERSLDGHPLVDGHPMYVGIFNADKLTFGALAFPPTKTTAANGTTLRTIHAQALLGYDLLATHHAIIDIGHSVLWMK